MPRERSPLTIVLANPRGFCAGVERAIEIVERAIERYGAPVYVRHEIVHNARVVETLRARGAIFVEEVDEIPAGAVTVFSAHGVARAVEDAAGRRGLSVIDATCPLVAKVHSEGRRYAEQGYDVVLIGHAGHPEIIGTLGQIEGRVHLIGTVGEVAGIAPRDPNRIAYVTQTTLSVIDTREIIAALQARFPKIVGPDTRDICYATQNRQAAVLEMAGELDLLLVVGARNSSNSNRLREIGEGAGVPSRLVESAGEIEEAWLAGVGRVGLTAGASAPEVIVREVIDRLGQMRETRIENRAGVVEPQRFRLPRELEDEATARQIGVA
ncbi:MAG: 4-hydroxy-3-methylbut-2-enyl diphosphate reductase [Pseudomonadota bacterium]